MLNFGYQYIKINGTKLGIIEYWPTICKENCGFTVKRTENRIDTYLVSKKSRVFLKNSGGFSACSQWPAF